MPDDDRRPEDGAEAQNDVGNEVGLEAARANIGDLVIRAGYAGERIAITRFGKQVAYLIGPKDFERLLALDADTKAVA